VYFITLPFLVRKMFTFYINDVLLFKCPLPGPKGLIRLRVLLTKLNSISCTNFLGERRASAVGLYSQCTMAVCDQVRHVQGPKFLPNPNSQLRSKITSIKVWRRFLNVQSNNKMARKHDSFKYFPLREIRVHSYTSLCYLV